MLRTILLAVVLVLAVLVAAGLLISLVTLAFLGLGTLFSHFFELTLFEATTVTLLGAVALMLLVYLVRTLFFPAEGEEYEDWEEQEDLDEEGQDTGISFLRKFSARGTEQEEEDIFTGMGRNAPCPCGSGKKFKYCHGRIRRR